MYKAFPRETVIFLRDDGSIPGWPSQVMTRNFGEGEDYGEHGCYCIQCSRKGPGRLADRFRTQGSENWAKTRI